MSLPNCIRSACRSRTALSSAASSPIPRVCRIQLFSTIQRQQLRKRPGLSRRTVVPRLTKDETTPVESLKNLESDVESEIVPELDTSSSLAEPALPWYLQAQSSSNTFTPEKPQHLEERTRLPQLPDSSPDVLPPLLDYVSTELGMDYLELLDLRSLDPPPALGTNLIMIVGTARGEKHLHVSADRFCRWLRNDHKLRPLADGLMGRNELKIKMRRRAKRLKILAHVGSLDDNEVDDGLRTGWVCVHIPGVQPADTAPVRSNPESFVGFDEDANAVTIVVQLLTEEKRSELSLESLWSNRLKRQEIRNEKDDVSWDPYPETTSSQQQQALIG